MFVRAIEYMCVVCVCVCAMRLLSKPLVKTKNDLFLCTFRSASVFFPNGRFSDSCRVCGNSRVCAGLPAGQLG